jgi:hypothetical protein
MIENQCRLAEMLYFIKVNIVTFPTSLFNPLYPAGSRYAKFFPSY